MLDLAVAMTVAVHNTISKVTSEVLEKYGPSPDVRIGAILDVEQL